MPTLEENVKAELLKRHAWSMMGLNDRVIPRDAFFNHVTPFIKPANLSQQDIVNILKTDERFVSLDSAADSEVKVFSEILYRVMNSAKPNNIQINTYYANLALHVDLSQSNNLDDILSGKFSLSLEQCCEQSALWFCTAVYCSIVGGLLYGGIRGFQHIAPMFDKLKDNLLNLIPIILIGLLSACAVLVAPGVLCYFARNLYLHVNNDSKLFSQTELTDFHEKYCSLPLVSVSTPEQQQHSLEVPLLPMSTANNAAGYGSITM